MLLVNLKIDHDRFLVSSASLTVILLETWNVFENSRKIRPYCSAAN